MAIIVCPKCSNEIYDSVELCTHCGYSIKKGANSKTKKLLIIFIIVVAIAYLMDKPDSNQPPQTPTEPKSTITKENVSDVFDAMMIMQRTVRQTLKNPKDAEFGNDIDGVIALGGNKYSVSSYVDATNSFGATVRTYYSGVLFKDKNNLWQIESLKYK